jgi:RNA polymerase sigma-70 factor (ECF subfamily)
MSYSMAWQNETSASRAVDGGEAVDVYETAFEQIFDRYKKLTASIAARYFQKPEQIEEIIQITFTKAYFELKKFRGAHDLSLTSWLGKITTNVCLDTFRDQKRKPTQFISDLSDAEQGSLAAALSHNETGAENVLIGRDLAEKLLSHLAADDRAIMQMLYAEEMSVGETAEVMGWSKSKIKVRSWRARNALRKILRNFL